MRLTGVQMLLAPRLCILGAGAVGTLDLIVNLPTTIVASMLMRWDVYSDCSGLKMGGKMSGYPNMFYAQSIDMCSFGKQTGTIQLYKRNP